MPLAAQGSPLGRWQPPMKFTGTLQGCGGNQLERFYSIHCSLIPVGPHRGKLLVWDKSGAVACSIFNGQVTGDRDQRWAIVDAEAQTIQPFAWTIPAAFAPPDPQVFEPHYRTPLTTRPLIQTAPTTVGYNTTFAVGFTLSSGRTLASASLIAPGSVTHSHDPNQRIVELGIVTSTATSATLSTPANPTKAPFGHYMLFLVDSAGEVSIAAWTQLL